jgi:exodeoxyribonuclease VIII
MKPGVYDNISNEDYHGGEGVSSSQIKVIATKTPAHYYWKYLDPENEHEPKDKHGPLAVGTLFHTLLLEPETDLSKEFIFVEEINRRSKAGKEAFAEVMGEATEKGSMIITNAEHENVKKMVKAARSQSLFNSLFTGGRAELSCFWEDPETGILCKCRPDYLHDDNIIVDLKSCRDADPEGAGKASYSFGYYISAAYYLDGVAAATGKPTESFIFAFMEKEAPYCAAPYVIGEEDIAIGRALYKRALVDIAACTKADRWPGYTTDITELELPPWARKQARTKILKEQ